MGLKVNVVDFAQVTDVAKDVSAVLFQYPDTDGSIRNFQHLIDKAHAAGVTKFEYSLYSFIHVYSLLCLCRKQTIRLWFAAQPI